MRSVSYTHLVVLALMWYGRSQGIPFVHLADLVATTAPAGLFFGRIANFINGELWGKVAYVPWAVIFPRSMPGTPIDLIAPRHPSQLYEAGLEGALLLAYMQWRFWRSDAVPVSYTHLPHLLRHPPGKHPRGEPARLEHDSLARGEETMAQQHLGNLRRLARAGRGLHDRAAIAAQRSDQGGFEFVDWEVARGHIRVVNNR